MVKKITACFFIFLLTSCSRPNIVEIPVSRSQIFYGQTVEDLQDNFGTPKKSVRYAYDVLEYTFKGTDIVREGWDKKVHFCDLKVYVQNNRVIDWCYEGNNCHVKEADVTKYLDDRLEERTERISIEDF